MRTHAKVLFRANATHRRLATLGALAFTVIAAPFALQMRLEAQDAPVASQAPPTPAECGIPGHHALLERMTAAFVLTCEQERKLEPLLHDEESVSKPLISFAAFTPDEKKAVMQEVKVAARKQILPLLTPEQQAKMNQEIDTVSKGGEGLQKGNGGGGKNGAKKNSNAAAVDPFEAEEALTAAISKYAALSDDEKKALIQQVKQASLRPDAPAMTPEQAKQVAAEVR